MPRPKVPVFEADADLTAAGGVGGLVVGAGRGAAPGTDPERRPRGVPFAPLIQRAPWPISSRATINKEALINDFFYLFKFSEN